MNTLEQEQELGRWLDGELSAEEGARFEARLQADPALREEAEALRALSLQVREHFPRLADIPHPDFFNSSIQERIAELDRAAVKQAEKASPWLRWLHSPWIVFAGAAALLLLVGQMMFQLGDNDDSTAVLSSYAPDSEIQPRSYHAKEADATVLILEGVQDIPADSEVVSYRSQPGRSQGQHLVNAFQGAPPNLHAANAGNPSFVQVAMLDQ